MEYILDYSGGPPSAKSIKAAGYNGVIRYVGFDSVVRPKCISKTEYNDHLAHGISVALVYENRAGDSAGGRAAGVIAAKLARQWATNIGFPSNRPIYFAIDTDEVTGLDFERVKEYFMGITDILPPQQVGVYGENDVIEYIARTGLSKWFWQTMAWSHHVVNPRDHLLQILGQVTIDGVICDRNEIHQKDYGQNNYSAPVEVDDMAAWSEQDSKNLAQLAHDMHTLVNPVKPDGSDDPAWIDNSIVGVNRNLAKVLAALKPTV